MSGEKGPRKIKLFCPSVSELVSWVALDEQRLDLGCIARVFGLEPSTLKLNGHFVSRGVDLVASSVTWRSLLSFFSAKGLSTGKDDRDALIVDGKLSKVGCKRGHDPQNSSDGILYKKEPEGGDTSKSSQHGDVIGLLKHKKLRDRNSGCWEGGTLLSRSNGLCFKRKQLPEDVSSLKKLKVNETNLGRSKAVLERGSSIKSSSIRPPPLKCSFPNCNMERVREDEVFVAALCKDQMNH